VETAAAHHERLDGGGYHRGLRAHQLGRATRVLACADVFEALTAARPYRGPMAPTRPSRVMRRDAGRHLCPEATDALEAALPGLEEPAQAA
jgi:HD-GYP domain-containing protein (c-di-GMP phosphodiesterase class II)